MPLRVGIPYQPYSFLIKKLNGLIIAQDDKGRVRYSGTDASTVIQAAVDALPAEGGKPFVCEGVYNIRSSIVIQKKSVFIQGMGYSTKFNLERGANTSIFELKDNSDNFRMSDIWLFGNKAENTAGHGVFLNNTTEVTNWRFTNVIISNFAGDGIRIAKKLYASIFQNCYIETNNGDGIHAEERFDNCFIQNCYIYSNGGNGISLYLAVRTHIYENQINLNDNNGIELDTSYEAEILGNQISQNGLSGIRAYFNSVRNRIIGNLIERNGREGIYGYGGFSDNVIIGNHFHDNSQVADNTYNDIWLRTDGPRYCLNNLIAGNHFLGAILTTKKAMYGVEESASTDDYNMIINNRFATLGTAPVLTRGANTIVKRNLGYVTERGGTATLAAGATSVTVSHGLAATPKIVLVTPHHSEITDIRITAKTATSFTAEVTTAPTADRTFDWQAEM